jgi:hypothetical protein
VAQSSSGENEASNPRGAAIGATEYAIVCVSSTPFLFLQRIEAAKQAAALYIYYCCMTACLLVLQPSQWREYIYTDIGGGEVGEKTQSHRALQKDDGAAGGFLLAARPTHCIGPFCQSPPPPLMLLLLGGIINKNVTRVYVVHVYTN